MADRLRNEDLQFLRTHKKVGDYVSTAQDSKHCIRLHQYLNIARRVRSGARRIDQDLVQSRPTQPRRNTSEDDRFMETIIASYIRETDHDLLGMLSADEHLAPEDLNRVCTIYARMVMWHDLQPLIATLRELGISVADCS